MVEIIRALRLEVAGPARIAQSLGTVLKVDYGQCI